MVGGIAHSMGEDSNQEYSRCKCGLKKSVEQSKSVGVVSHHTMPYGYITASISIIRYNSGINIITKVIVMTAVFSLYNHS